MSTKWNLIVNVAACSSCGNCSLAVKDEYVGNTFPGYSAPQPTKGQLWLWVDRVVRGDGAAVDVAHVPKTCNHCDNAPCQKAAPDAVHKRDDGIVVIDPVKAVGRREIVDACPYGAVFWDEQTQLPQTWPFDAHLLDSGWLEPRCVQVCPTGALSAVKVSDEAMASRVEQEGFAVLKPELGTKPRVYYLNLWRAQSQFIAGNVAGLDDAGRAANLADVEVQLVLDGVETRSLRTDAFGDFKFDQLNAGQRYELHVGGNGPTHVLRSGTVDQSVNLGSIQVDSALRGPPPGVA